MNSKAKYFLPSIPQWLFLAVFLTLSFHSGSPLLYDADTGYHIRAGEYILSTFTVPDHDIFSFLSPPPKWTAHEWLSEVIMGLLHRAFGLTGVVLFFILLISLTYPLLFRMMRSCRGNILADVVILFLVIISSTLHWLARPHIFSLILTVVWYRLLEDFRKERKNRLYLLPPLMLLWVNLHGGFMGGFLFLSVYSLGSLIAFRYSAREGREQAKRNALFLGGTFFACLLVSLVNPYGHQILFFPFRLVSQKYLMDHVNEFLSPNFHQVMPFKYLLLLTIAILAVSVKKLDFVEISLLLIFLDMSLYSARYIPLFCIVTAPVLARQAGAALARKEGPRFSVFRNKSDHIAAADTSVKGHAWVILGLLLVTGAAATGKMEFRFDRTKKPVDAVEFLKKERITGNMFNNDEFGDYMIYAAYPQYRVFFDGRSDMYGAERLKDYMRVIGLETGWEKVIAKYDIGWIFFDADSLLSRSLYEQEGWHLIYADKVANIFVKKTPEYRDVIRKFGNVSPFLPETGEEDA
ncbi:MAG: hypothetical protein WBA34_09610 [Candidatus Deferrimicrobiaceae bacterium]